MLYLWPRNKTKPRFREVIVSDFGPQNIVSDGRDCDVPEKKIIEVFRPVAQFGIRRGAPRSEKIVKGLSFYEAWNYEESMVLWNVFENAFFHKPSKEMHYGDCVGFIRRGQQGYIFLYKQTNMGHLVMLTFHPYIDQMITTIIANEEKTWCDDRSTRNWPKAGLCGLRWNVTVSDNASSRVGTSFSAYDLVLEL